MKTDPAIPPGLPPLPPNTRYGGLLRDHSGRLSAYVYDEKHRAGWDFGLRWRGMEDDPQDDSAGWHVALPIEAVRDEPTAEDHANDLRRFIKVMRDEPAKSPQERAIKSLIQGDLAEQVTYALIPDASGDTVAKVAKIIAEYKEPAKDQPASGERFVCPECNGWLGNEMIAEIGMVNCANCKHRWSPPAPATEDKGCEGETPMTDAMREQVAGKTTSLIEMTDFARDLERKLDEARTALDFISKMDPFACNADPRSVAASALARVDAGNADALAPAGGKTPTKPTNE